MDIDIALAEWILLIEIAKDIGGRAAKGKSF